MSYITDIDKQNLEDLKDARLGRIGDRHIVQDKYGNRYVREEAVNAIIDEVNTLLDDLDRGTSISSSLSILNRSIMY